MSIPIAFYYGTADSIIAPAMTRTAATKFSAATMVSDGGRHYPPQSEEPRKRDRQLHQRLHLRLHSFAAARSPPIIAAFQSPRHAAATVYQSKGAIATAVLGWRQGAATFTAAGPHMLVEVLCQPSAVVEEMQMARL